ncbi:MAG: transporter substrate-binding domain-containing protein, partial [Gemmatimonadota bacterium]
TPAAAWAERHLRGARLERFDTNEEAYGALRSGAVDVLIDDSPIASWFVRSTPGLRIVEALPGTGSEYAMVFARGGGSLLSGVDGVLEGLIRSGAMARIRGRWLGTP